MNRKRALWTFVYWGDQIVGLHGGTNKRAEEMRSAWAWAIDTGVYRKLPKDVLAVVADEVVLRKFRERRLWFSSKP